MFKGAFAEQQYVGMRQWQRLRELVVRPLKQIVTSGLSPRRLVLTVCVGGAIGLLPLLWGSSLLCLWLAQRFKLNHLVLQSVNYLLYPAQLALLLPFCKLGLLLLPFGATVAPDQLGQLLTAFPTGIAQMLPLLFWLTCKAVAAWLVTVPPLGLLVYLVLLATVVKRKESASALIV